MSARNERLAAGRGTAALRAVPPLSTAGAEDRGASVSDIASVRSRVNRVGIRRVREVLRDEGGAVTAEYAIIIMAAVAFAGVLVAIIRSEQIREMLVTLVENALGSAG